MEKCVNNEKMERSERALLLNYWLNNNPSGYIVNRILETNAKELLELAKVDSCFDGIYKRNNTFRDELWAGVQVRGRGHGFSLNSILDKACHNPCFSCLDGQLATHPEVSYYIGKRRRATVNFAQLYAFLVEKVGESPSTSRDLMWLLSFNVFVANLRGRLLKALRKIGVVEG